MPYPKGTGTSQVNQFTKPFKWGFCSTLAFLAILFFFPVETNFQLGFEKKQEYHVCKFPLPNIFAENPPHRNDNEIRKASSTLHKWLSKRTGLPDVDSLSIAVVTSAGTIFEHGYGVLRANETAGEQGSVDQDSIYRIASISKMFTVLETLLLRERGVLNWDDPAKKYIPELSYPSYGWSEYLQGQHSIAENEPRITLRQLASHMSGMGRDYPPDDMGDWPKQILTAPSTPKVPEISYEDFLAEIAKYPLVNLPYSNPIYSNTGFSLLGLVNIAANKLANNGFTEPDTHKDLVKRDIFDPMGLNSSFFRVPASLALRERIAVPKKNSYGADMSLHDVHDPAGGQYSSLRDLISVMQAFLSPNATNSGLSSQVLREWLRPLHIWDDAFQQVGAPWEIMTAGTARLYTKGGNLSGYHSLFAINPQLSYGVIALLTGTAENSAMWVEEAVSHFNPVFENLQKRQILQEYGGVWRNGDNRATVGLVNGALYIRQLIIRGTDVLFKIQSVDPNVIDKEKVKPVALWSTGRTGEFRMAFGRPRLNSNPDAGCLPYWASIDPPFSRGAPVDLLYWEDGLLVYPSAGVRLARMK